MLNDSKVRKIIGVVLMVISFFLLIALLILIMVAVINHLIMIRSP